MQTLHIGGYHHQVNYRHKKKMKGIRSTFLSEARLSLYGVITNKVEFKHGDGFLQLRAK